MVSVLNRKKLLFENFFVYGLSGILNKIIPIITVPIIAYLLPNEQYFGINDLVGTITSLCCSIGMLGMWDTLFRFFFDSDDITYKRNVCSTALFISFSFTIIVCVALTVVTKELAANVYGSVQYKFLVYFNVCASIIGNMCTVLSAPTRVLNQRKRYIIVSTIAPVITYSIAIFLILEGWYLSALPLASIFSSFIMACVFFYFNRHWFLIRSIKKSMIIDLLKYGLPIMPQHIIYFIMHSSDKLMIASLIGQNYNGLYAVGGKFASISQLIYTAFAGGWVYYRYATMNSNDQVSNISRIFEFLGIVSFISFAFICVISPFIVKLFFKRIYYEAYIVIPYLFLAPLIQMLFQVVAGQFSIQKKTWLNLIFLFSGAVVNIVLNYILIPKMGIEGASLATLIGYITIAVLATLICIRVNMLKVSLKFYSSILLLLLFYSLWRFNLSAIKLHIATLLFLIAVFFVLYYNDLCTVFNFKVLYARKRDSL